MRESTSTSLSNQDSTAKDALVLFSVLLMLLGIGLTVMLLRDFSQPTYGMGFKIPGRLELYEFVLAVLLGFYHFTCGLICLGISNGLSSKAPTISITDHLLGFGWGAIAVGVVGAGLLLSKTYNLGPLSRYGALGAAMIAFYHVSFGTACIGLSGVLTIQRNNSVKPTKKKTTTCKACNTSFEGELRGQFCEECGEQL